MGRNAFWLEYLLREGSFTGTREELIDRVITKLLQVRLDMRSTFDSGVDHVLVREFAKARPWKLPTNLTPDEGLRTSRRALAWLAYRMSVAGVTALTEEEAKKDFQSWLETLPVPLGWTPDDLLHLGQDAQLLNYPYDQSAGFRHRLLQETLTAWGLTHEPAIKGNWTREIEAHSDDVAWWQTLVLLAEGGSNIENLLEPILQAPTARRLTLAAVLAEHVQGASTVPVEYRERVRSRFYADIRSSFSDEHKRAIDALQRLAGNAVLALLRDMLTREGHKKGVFDAGVELLVVLDSRMLQALSDILASEDFAQAITVEQLQPVQALLPLLHPPTAAALLSQVAPAAGASMISHMRRDFQRAMIETLMQPAAVGYVIAALEPSVANAILANIAAGRIAHILSAVEANVALSLVSKLEPTLAAMVISMLEPKIGAQLLQGMPSGVASRILAETTPEAAGRILVVMPPQVVQQILAAMPLEVAGGILTETTWKVAVQVLMKMTPQAVGETLAVMPPHVLQQVLTALSAEAVGRIFDQTSPMVARRILNVMAADSIPTIFAAMSPQAVAQTLAGTPPHNAAGILTAMAPQRAARILAGTPAHIAVGSLRAMAPDQAAWILAQATEQTAGPILVGLPPRTAGSILAALSPATTRRVLAGLPPEAASRLLKEVMDRRE